MLYSIFNILYSMLYSIFNILYFTFNALFNIQNNVFNIQCFHQYIYFTLEEFSIQASIDTRHLKLPTSALPRILLVIEGEGWGGGCGTMVHAQYLMGGTWYTHRWNQYQRQ